MTLLPPPEAQLFSRILATIYALLFLIGLCGNVSALTCVVLIWDTLGRRRRDNVLIYLTTLCCVDLAVMLSLPMEIVDVLWENWVFGAHLCKLNWLLESTGKITSTFILSAVSFDRFIQSSPYSRPWLRSRNTALSIITLSFLAALALLSPLPYFAEVQLIPLGGPFAGERQDGSGFLFQIAMTKCRTTMSTRLYPIVCIYIFVLGFVIPGRPNKPLYTLDKHDVCQETTEACMHHCG